MDCSSVWLDDGVGGPEVEREGDEVMEVLGMAGPWLVSTTNVSTRRPGLLLYTLNNN